MLKRLNNLSVFKVALLQSISLTLYIFLVGNIIIHGNELFGSMKNTPILGPMLMITLFVVSALISSSIVLAYPFYTFWVKKDLEKAMKIVAGTVGFLITYFFIYFIILTLAK